MIVAITILSILVGVLTLATLILSKQLKDSIENIESLNTMMNAFHDSYTSRIVEMEMDIENLMEEVADANL